MKERQFYMKATGPNKYGAGTPNWLKIRNVNVLRGGHFELEVKIKGQQKFVDLTANQAMNVIFGEGWPGLEPVSWPTVRTYYSRIQGD